MRKEKAKNERETKKYTPLYLPFLPSLSLSLSLFFSSPVERRVKLGAVRERPRVVNGDLVARLGLDSAVCGAGLFFFFGFGFGGFDEVRGERREKKGGKSGRERESTFRTASVLFLALLRS